MQAFLNGQFLPEEQAVVSISDRGFLYGDGVFETIRVRNGRPLWWERHLERLQRGVRVLKLRLPWPLPALRDFAHKLIGHNAMPESVLRLSLTRGSGPRGYSLKGVGEPTTVMTMHLLPAPSDSLSLATASVRLAPNELLDRCKTSNKLLHILARVEAEEHSGNEAV